MASALSRCLDCVRLAAYLTGRITAIHDILRVDHTIGADPHDDIARPRDVEGALDILNHEGDPRNHAETHRVRPGRPPRPGMGSEGRPPASHGDGGGHR